jgi:cephalosporin-C deacetylase-like acetyl esterase
MNESKLTVTKYLLLQILASFVLILAGRPLSAEEPSDTKSQLNFVQSIADQLRQNDRAPTTLPQWQTQSRQLRSNLLNAWGGFPQTPAPLNAQVLGKFEGDGFTVERIVFQTLPTVLMTANAYVPKDIKANQRLPSVLCVHGHWSGAKQDPVVQSRCIGLAKLGFFVLCVDAFGAGERAIEKKLGEYHGEMTGAMLIPVGRPLSGIQVYENRRAVDYLQSRPEVDLQRIGITGASGGGNQTMYAGAMDERFQCVVPTCSVGTYRSYLGAACCMCEVVPGAIRFTEEGDLLGLSANRGLMVTSATQDAFQFSVGQAAISFERAKAIAALTNSTVKHTIIESPHHYNQPMREAMYGWMTLHLKKQGDGGPIAEPTIKTFDPESLRCYPGDTRPDNFTTIPRFAYQMAMNQLHARAEADQAHLSALRSASASDEELRKLQTARRDQLKSALNLLSDLQRIELDIESSTPTDVNQMITKITYNSEPGIRLNLLADPANPSTDRKTALLVDLDHTAEITMSSDRAKKLRADGWRILVPELRAAGRLAYPNDKIANAIDHNTAEWSLWIGRPLLSQWTVDVMQAINVISTLEGTTPIELSVVGEGSAGVLAIVAAALDERIKGVSISNSLVSFVSPKPYRGVRLGMLVPNMIQSVGDVGHIAALIAPRPLTIEGGTDGTGNQLDVPTMIESFQFASDVYKSFQAESKLLFR